MRVFGTPASIDVQASVWRMFLITSQNAVGTTSQYYGYRWNRMSEGFGTQLADASSWSPSSYPSTINSSFTISPNNSYIANTHGSGTIRVQVRPFNKSGITEGPGVQFSAVAFPLRGTGPSAIQWNSAETAAFFGYNTSPYIFATTFSASGWGTLYSAPVTAAPSPSNVAINLVTNEVASSNDPGILGAPAINAWTFSTSTGWGTKLSDPAAGFPTAQQQVPPAFTKNGDAIVCKGTNSPYVFVYPWTAGLGFGTKYADPADLTYLSVTSGINFNPTQTVLGLVIGTGFLEPTNFYQWSNASGFGTKYSSMEQLAGKPTWSPDGKSVGGGAEGTDTLTYRWNDSTGFGTQYSNPVQPLSSLGAGYHGFFSN